MKNILKNNSGNIRSGWKITLVFLAVAGGQLLISLVIGIAIGIISGINPEGYRESINILYKYMKYMTSIMTIIIVWMFFRFMEKKTLSQSGFTSIKKGYGDLLAGLFLGAVSMTAIFFVLLGTNNIEIKESLLKPNIGSGIWNGLILFIFVGIEEEYLFRGYIMNALSQTGKKWVVLIVSALIFSLAHGLNPNVSAIGLFNIFLVGLLFAYMFIQTQSLWMPIGYHITWNYFQGSIFGFPVSGTSPEGIYTIIRVNANVLTGGSFGPEGGLLTTFAIILGAIFVYIYQKMNSESKFDFEV